MYHCDFLNLSYLYHCAVQELHQLPDYLQLFLLLQVPWSLCQQKSVDLFHQDQQYYQKSVDLCHQGQQYYQKLVNLFLYLILRRILLKLNLQLHSHIRGHSEKQKEMLKQSRQIEKLKCKSENFSCLSHEKPINCQSYTSQVL